MLERSILDSTIDFLEAKNVDTSDLKERKTTILNSGVIVSGGSIEAKSPGGGATRAGAGDPGEGRRRACAGRPVAGTDPGELMGKKRARTAVTKG